MRDSKRVLKAAAWLLAAALAGEQTVFASGDLPFARAAVPEPDAVAALPALTKTETVIQIRDAHAQLGAQRRIADILDDLVSRYDLQLVAVEGSAGPIDPSLVSSYPDAAVRRAAGEALLAESKISAAEWQAIRSGRSMDLYGAENESLYRQNVQALDKLVELSPAARRQTAELRRRIRRTAASAVSARLLAAWDGRAERLKSDFSFQDYWKKLSSAAGTPVDAARYRALAEIDALFALETAVDFRAAERERQELLGLLAKRLRAEAFKEIVRLSLEFRQSRAPAGAYHKRLLEEARRASVDLSGFGDLERYAVYLERFERLDLMEVLREIEAFENELLDRCAAAETEKIWLEAARSAERLDRMLAASLTAQEYEEIRGSPRGVDFDRISELFGRLPDSGGPLDGSAVRLALPWADRFYRLAHERNQSLLSNTLARMRRDGLRVAALVTGGFHTEGIRGMLESEGAGSWVILPRFENQGERPYVTVLTKKPKEFESALKGSDLFLAPSSVLQQPSYNDQAAVLALVLAAARLSGGQAPRGMRLYLRERARPARRANAVLSAKTIGRVVRGAGRGETIRRERGGTTVRIPSASGQTAVFLVRQSNGRFQYPVLVDDAPGFSPVAAAAVAAKARPSAPDLLLRSARPAGLAERLLAAPAGARLCGVIGQLSPAQPAAPGDKTVVSKSQRETAVKMARKTKERGSQALGGAALVRFPQAAFASLPVEGVGMERIAANPAEIAGTPRPEDREGFVGVKLLNERGFDIVNRFRRYWTKAEDELEKKGFEAASVESELDHSRLATGGGNSVPATHPHQHLDLRRAWIWRIENGGPKRVLKIYQSLIAHNGDFNAAFLFGREHSNGEIRAWLDRVLHRQYGAKWWLPVQDVIAVFGNVVRGIKRYFLFAVNAVRALPGLFKAGPKAYWATIKLLNDVEGDSPGIAGMNELLWTENNWYASVRAAFQFATARSLTEAVPTAAELERWTGVVESEFVRRLSRLYPGRRTLSMQGFDAAEGAAFVEATVERLSRENDWSVRGREETERFARTAFYLFMNHDGREALRAFMRMTTGVQASTYGLKTVNTLQPDRANYASYKQPFYVGYNPSTNAFRAGSDLDTVRSALTDPDALILRLNQEKGETFEAGLGLDRNRGLYSLAENREFTEAETAERWLPKNSPYLEVLHSPDAEDRVLRDLNGIPFLMQKNHRRWNDPGLKYDPKDPRTYHLGTAEHFFELVLEWVERFERLQRAVRAAGIDEAVSPTAPDIVIIGIENSLDIGLWWSDLLQTMFPLLRDRVRVIGANEFVLDPNRFLLGPNTVVWNISRSGQTFPSFHSTVETARLRARLHEAQEKHEALTPEEQEKVLSATDAYLRRLEERRSVREVFVMTRDLGSEMAAVIGQNFRPESPFLRTILTDGGWKSDAEPASQSVTLAYQTLVEMTLYLARRLKEVYPNGSRPLGLAFKPEQLDTLGEMLASAVARTVPRTLGIDAAGNLLPNETVSGIDRQGRSMGRSVQESGWYTLLMKGYVFGSVLFKLPLAASMIGLGIVYSPAFAWMAGLTAVFDAVFYTWGTELLTYADRLFTGRTLLARHGTRTLKILARRTFPVLDVFVGKLFAEAPTYFALFRRAANPVNDALQREGLDATVGTMVAVVIPDGRLSSDLAEEASSTRMTAVQTKATGNRFDATPDVFVVTTNPDLAALKKTKGFQEVLVVPSETHAILRRNAESMPAGVRDRFGDTAFLVSDMLALLVANYRLFWSMSDRASRVRVPFFGSVRIWDTAKTQDQAMVHTTAAPNAPKETEIVSEAKDWRVRAFPGLQEFRPAPEKTPAVYPNAKPLAFPLVDVRRNAVGTVVNLVGRSGASSDSKFRFSDDTTTFHIRQLHVHVANGTEQFDVPGGRVEVDYQKREVVIRLRDPLLHVGADTRVERSFSSFVLPLDDVLEAQLEEGEARGARLAAQDDEPYRPEIVNRRDAPYRPEIFNRRRTAEEEPYRPEIVRHDRQKTESAPPAVSVPVKSTAWFSRPALITVVAVLLSAMAGWMFFNNGPVRGPDADKLQQEIVRMVEQPKAPEIQKQAAEKAEAKKTAADAEKTRLKTYDRALRNFRSVDYHLNRDNRPIAERNFRFANKLLAGIPLSAPEKAVADSLREKASAHLEAYRAPAPEAPEAGPLTSIAPPPVEFQAPAVLSVPMPAIELPSAPVVTAPDPAALPDILKSLGVPDLTLPFHDVAPVPPALLPSSGVPGAGAGGPPPPPKPVPPAIDLAALETRIRASIAQLKTDLPLQIQALLQADPSVDRYAKDLARHLSTWGVFYTEEGGKRTWHPIKYDNVIENRGLPRIDWLQWESGQFVVSGSPAAPGLQALDIFENPSFANRLLRHAVAAELSKRPEFSNEKKARQEAERLLKKFREANAPKKRSALPADSTIKVGVFLENGQTPADARSIFERAVGPERAERFTLSFSRPAEPRGEASRRFVGEGTAFFVDADSLRTSGARLALLKALAALDADAGAVVSPFVRLLADAGEALPLTPAERADVLAGVAAGFPKPGPVQIVFTADGTLVRLDNGIGNLENNARLLAEAADRALARSLERPQDASGLTAALRRFAEAAGSFLSPSEKNQSKSVLDAKLKRFAAALAISDRTRWTLADRSYETDLSSVEAAAAARIPNERKTIVVDSDIFTKDAGGWPFAQRMERLDRLSKGLFDYVLLVRDGRFTDRAGYLAAYPEAAVFGSNVIFAPGLTQVSELTRYRGQVVIATEFLAVSSEAGGLSIGASGFAETDRAYLVSLGSGAETTMGLLEEAALTLVRHKQPFTQLIYLPPVTSIDYGRLLARYKQALQAETAA